MSDTITIARSSAKGGFNLLWGAALSTILTTISGIVIARLLTPSEYGVVGIALIGPNFIRLFRDWGVNSSIIKYTAQYKSESRTAKVKTFLVTGLLFEFILGSSLLVISIILSNSLATIFHRPYVKPLIEVASFTIIGGALLTATQSAFIGYERMKLYNSTVICQTATRAVLAPLLIIIGFGAFGAVLGTTISFLLSGLIATLIFYQAIYKNLRVRTNKQEMWESLKSMLKFGIPLSISTILRGILLQFYAILMVIFCTDLLIGNYQVASTLGSLLTFFIIPIGTALFPAFSKLDCTKHPTTLRNIFTFSVKLTALTVAPTIGAVMVLSQPLTFTLFGEGYSYAPLFLSIYSINYLFPVFGSISVEALFRGQGKTGLNLALVLITCSVGFPVSLLLIPTFGILGLIATNIIHGIPFLVVGLWWAKKRFTATIDRASSAKILLAASIAATITFLVVSHLYLPSWINLIIGILIFLAAYTLITPLTRAITRADIQNLRKTLNNLGPISRIFTLLLDIMEKLTR